MPIIGFSGFSGVGKDEAASVLINEKGAISICLSDHAKRQMSDLYGWSYNQLFGESKFRNVGDMRYPKSKYFDQVNTVADNDPEFFLSPREALQKYCELMNELYYNTWCNMCIKNHMLMNEVVDGNTYKYMYSKMKGVELNDGSRKWSGTPITCLSDIRHRNEFYALKKIGAVLIRIKRSSISKPPYDHKSEIEQTTIHDSEFDHIIQNDGTKDELHSAVRHIASKL